MSWDSFVASMHSIIPIMPVLNFLWDKSIIIIGIIPKIEKRLCMIDEWLNKRKRSDQLLMERYRTSLLNFYKILSEVTEKSELTPEGFKKWREDCVEFYLINLLPTFKDLLISTKQSSQKKVVIQEKIPIFLDITLKFINAINSENWIGKTSQDVYRLHDKTFSFIERYIKGIILPLRTERKGVVLDINNIYKSFPLKQTMY